MKKRRNSSIELLKIIGMVMIVVFHCNMTVTSLSNSFYPILEEGIDFASLPKGFLKLTLLTSGYYGATGNLIFIICASWFLCQSDSVHLNKILTFLLATIIISVSNMIIIGILFPSVELTSEYIHDCFFPVTYGHNWFITCYIMLYAIHAGLNAAIRQMKRTTHLLVSLIMFFMYTIVTLYAQHNFYYSSHFMVCVAIYVLVSYAQKYVSDKRHGVMIILAGILGFIYLIFSKAVGYPVFVRDKGLLFWAKNNNPFLILLVLGIVIIVAEKNFYNPTINYLSGLSLILYLIHENLSFRGIVRPLIWEAVSSLLSTIPIVLRFWIFTSIILAYGIGISMLFNELVMPWIRKLADFLSDEMATCWEFICTELFNDRNEG